MPYEICKMECENGFVQIGMTQEVHRWNVQNAK